MYPIRCSRQSPCLRQEANCTICLCPRSSIATVHRRPRPITPSRLPSCGQFSSHNNNSSNNLLHNSIITTISSITFNNSNNNYSNLFIITTNSQHTDPMWWPFRYDHCFKNSRLDHLTNKSVLTLSRFTEIDRRKMSEPVNPTILLRPD